MKIYIIINTLHFQLGQRDIQVSVHAPEQSHQTLKKKNPKTPTQQPPKKNTAA